MDASNGDILFPPSLWKMVFSKKKIIDRLINDRTGVVAGKPILSVLGLAKQAESLYDNLANLGYKESNGNFKAIGWDWRKGIDDALVQIAIAKAIDDFGQATLVVHSTGGLVFRAFIEANPAYRSKIDQVIAFAVPWAGTLDAFAALTGNVSMKVLGLFGFSAKEVQSIVTTCQAAYDLCPPGIPELPTHRFPNWTPTIANAPPIVNICGWGATTFDSYKVINGAVKFATAKNGDGTVPFSSSSWLNAPREFYVPVGAYERNAIPEEHPRIWDSPPVVELLDTLVGNAQPKNFIAAAVDGDDNFPSVSPVRIRIAAQDANGDALPNAKVTLRLPPNNLSWPINKRLDIALARPLPNNANGFARIGVDVDWVGGGEKTAIAIRVV